MLRKFDLAIIGAGSGGIGAVLAAARLGLSVILIEKAETLGGNAVRGGVHVWEPGGGGTGIPFEIYRRLRRIPNAVGIYSFGRHCCLPNSGGFPGGEQLIDPARRYLDSLRRHGARSIAADEAFAREHWHGVPFEPAAYAEVVSEMLNETGRCAVLTNTAFRSVRAAAGNVESVLLDNGEEIQAAVYVDATADVLFGMACGCATVMGEESRQAYDEPSAPASATQRINAVSLIYRVTPTGTPQVEPLPDGIPAECWWAERFPVVSCTEYPCGDRNMNMLPTMEGDTFLRLGYAAAYTECCDRVRAHWHHLQTTFPEFQRYRLSWTAPALGVRETRRIIGDYVLTQHDLLQGLPGQNHPDIIAIADHGMDTHGRGGACGEVPAPYGIPYRCLIPKGFRNLLVACRGASFSSIAASSCRLSRTMMQLGQAAGTAAAIARDRGALCPRSRPTNCGPRCANNTCSWNGRWRPIWRRICGPKNPADRLQRAVPGR